MRRRLCNGDEGHRDRQVRAAPLRKESPRYGGTLIIGSGGDPGSLHLAASFSTVDTLAAANIYSFLVVSDAELAPQPDLAESWKVSDDGLTYTFNLVKHAVWHDGKPFTSADVKFSLAEVLGKLHPRGAVVLKVVDSIETPTPYSVVLKLKYPYDPLITSISRPPTSRDSRAGRGSSFPTRATRTAPPSC